MNVLGWIPGAHEILTTVTKTNKDNSSIISAIDENLTGIVDAAKQRKGKTLSPDEIPAFIEALKIVIAGGPYEPKTTK